MFVSAGRVPYCIETPHTSFSNTGFQKVYNIFSFRAVNDAVRAVTILTLDAWCSQRVFGVLLTERECLSATNSTRRGYQISSNTALEANE